MKIRKGKSVVLVKDIGDELISGTKGIVHKRIKYLPVPFIWYEWLVLFEGYPTPVPVMSKEVKRIK